jgi:hypothetical protein
MINCEGFGSDCHMRLRAMWKYKTLLLWLVFLHETWMLVALNTCNKTLYSDNWSKRVTCHESSREFYCGNQDAVQFSMV